MKFATIYIAGLVPAGALLAVAGIPIGEMTAPAILGWYTWYTTRHTIPGLIKTFTEELAAEREVRNKMTEAINGLACNQASPQEPDLRSRSDG